MRHDKQKSALTHVLLGLIPYTRQNFDLAFRPHRFFNELERISGCKEQTLRSAFSRAKRGGLIKISQDGIELTDEGKLKVQPFTATKLKEGARLMIAFDIPEAEAHLRRRLRHLLKQWEFEQVQKSVWLTDYDYREVLINTIENLELGDCVQLYECAKLFPPQ